MSAQDLNELFDVVDENDCVIGQQPRGIVHAQKLFHRAVHLLVINEKGEMLLQKRSLAKDTCPGLFSTACAGHVDAGETYETAVLREAKEELGITLALGEISCIGAQKPSEENGFEFVKVFLFRSSRERFIFNREEIESLHWLSADELFEKIERVPAEFARSFIALINDFFEIKSVPVETNFENAKYVFEIERLGGNGILRVPVVGSNRCRRMTLKHTQGQIVVVVNERLQVNENLRATIELFATKNRPWIEHQLQKSRERQFVLKTAGTLSEYLRNNPQLDLPMSGNEFCKRVEIVDVPLKPFYLLSENDEKLIIGVRKNYKERDLLAQLKMLAGTLLEPQLRLLAERCGVSVREFHIKDSQRQWGSCSRNGNINLKWSLILMPAEIRNHVILHELCHRIHMNHSANFWEQLNRWDAQTAEHDRALNRFAKIFAKF